MRHSNQVFASAVMFLLGFYFLNDAGVSEPRSKQNSRSVRAKVAQTLKASNKIRHLNLGQMAKARSISKKQSRSPLVPVQLKSQAIDVAKTAQSYERVVRPQKFPTLTAADYKLIMEIRDALRR